MNLLIVYATNSGSTYLTAKIIKQTVETTSKGSKIQLKKAGETSPDDLKQVDVVLMGSPSWYVNKKDGQPHETILELMEKLQSDADKEILKSKNIALFGCGDSSYINFCGAVTEMENFVKSFEGTLFAPSLKIDGFYFDLDGNTVKAHEWAKMVAQKLPVSQII